MDHIIFADFNAEEKANILTNLGTKTQEQYKDYVKYLFSFPHNNNNSDIEKQILSKVKSKGDNIEMDLFFDFITGRFKNLYKILLDEFISFSNKTDLYEISISGGIITINGVEDYLLDIMKNYIKFHDFKNFFGPIKIKIDKYFIFNAIINNTLYEEENFSIRYYNLYHNHEIFTKINIIAFMNFIPQLKSNKTKNTRLNKYIIDRIEAKFLHFENEAVANTGLDAEYKIKLFKNINTLFNAVNFDTYYLILGYTSLDYKYLKYYITDISNIKYSELENLDIAELFIRYKPINGFESPSEEFFVKTLKLIKENYLLLYSDKITDFGYRVFTYGNFFNSEKIKNLSIRNDFVLIKINLLFKLLFDFCNDEAENEIIYMEIDVSHINELKKYFQTEDELKISRVLYWKFYEIGDFIYKFKKVKDDVDSVINIYVHNDLIKLYEKNKIFTDEVINKIKLIEVKNINVDMITNGCIFIISIIYSYEKDLNKYIENYKEIEEAHDSDNRNDLISLFFYFIKNSNVAKYLSISSDKEDNLNIRNLIKYYKYICLMDYFNLISIIYEEEILNINNGKVTLSYNKNDIIYAIESLKVFMNDGFSFVIGSNLLYTGLIDHLKIKYGDEDIIEKYHYTIYSTLLPIIGEKDRNIRYLNKRFNIKNKKYITLFI
jgi:hypothetical protein